MTELISMGVVSEGFHITGQMGYSLVMTGIVATRPPLPTECVSTTINSNVPPPVYGEGGPSRCLTYSKNGGPKQRMFTDGVYGADKRPENMTFLNNQDNTGVAFFQYAGGGEPDFGNMNTFYQYVVLGDPFYDYFPEDVSRVGIAGLSPVHLEYLRGGVFYYQKKEYYVSDSTSIDSLTNYVTTDPITNLLPGKTTLTFYPTVGHPPADDDFYLMDGSDTAESITIVSCASVPIPKAVGAEEDSDVLLFTTTSDVLYSTEMPLTISLSPEATVWELVDRDTGEVLANSDGDLVTGLTLTTDTSVSIGLGRLGGNRINRYSLNGVIDFVVFRYNDEVRGGSPITGLLQVEEFSKNVARVNFDTSILDVIVPEYLPKNMINLSGMFSRSPTFNQDISMWDVSDVRNLDTFIYYGDFNQDVSGWNTAKVEGMRYLFSGCSNFNQDISQWNVSNLTDADSMLSNALAFNQDLSGWDVNGRWVSHVRFGENSQNWVLPRPNWKTS